MRALCVSSSLQAASGGEKFDRIVSVGMMEHVGPSNFPTFFRKTLAVIKPDGLFLLHTIGNSIDDRNQDPWFDKYIFRGAVIPGPQTFFQPGCIGEKASVQRRYIYFRWGVHEWVEERVSGVRTFRACSGKPT